jgi:hypothetical protein
MRSRVTLIRSLLGAIAGFAIGLALVLSALVSWRIRQSVMTGVAIPRNPTSIVPLLPYLLLFPAVGVTTALLWSARPRLLRAVVIGALITATGTAYLAASAPYRRPWVPLIGSVSDQAAVGAGLGALAGLLLGLLDWWRERRSPDRG